VLPLLGSNKLKYFTAVIKRSDFMGTKPSNPSPVLTQPSADGGYSWYNPVGWAVNSFNWVKTNKAKAGLYTAGLVLVGTLGYVGLRYVGCSKPEPPKAQPAPIVEVQKKAEDKKHKVNYKDNMWNLAKSNYKLSAIKQFYTKELEEFKKKHRVINEDNVVISLLTRDLSEYNLAKQPGCKHFGKVGDIVAYAVIDGELKLVSRSDGIYTDELFVGRHRGSKTGDEVYLPALDVLGKWRNEHTSSGPKSAQTQEGKAQSGPATAQPLQPAAPSTPQQAPVTPTAPASKPEKPREPRLNPIVSPKSAAYAGPATDSDYVAAGLTPASVSRTVVTSTAQAPVVKPSVDWKSYDSNAVMARYNELAQNSSYKGGVEDVYGQLIPELFRV
jgi:hypothetical protein